MTYQPIELTETEVDALVVFMQRTTSLNYRDRAFGLIDRLNTIRKPVPVGTVRVDGKGLTAVLCAECEGDDEPWFIVAPDFDEEYATHEYVANWKTVYTP